MKKRFNKGKAEIVVNTSAEVRSQVQIIWSPKTLGKRVVSEKTEQSQNQEFRKTYNNKQITNQTQDWTVKEAG